MNDSGSYLVGVTRVEVAEEIKQLLLQLSQRWKDASVLGRTLKLQGEADKGKREYEQGISELEAWLDKAEPLVAGPVQCQLQPIHTHIIELQVCM